MTDLKDILERRRVCRIRYTKAEKLVIRHQESAEQLIANEAPDAEINLAIRTCTTAMEPLHSANRELQEVQEQLDFDPNHEERLDGMDPEARKKEEDNEEKFREGYVITIAKVNHLEESMKSSNPKSEGGRSSNASEEAKASLSPEQFTESLKEAFKSLNTGITADQMTQIIDTMTQRKRQINIPKFKGDPDMFDQWRELVEAEINKPGYSEVEKVHYTLSVLEGEPSKVVAALKDPTYEDLINALENKYGDVLARVQKAVIEIAQVQQAVNPTVKELDPLCSKLVAAWNYLLKKTNNSQDLLNSSWILTALVRPKVPKTLLRKWDTEVLRAEKNHQMPNSCLPIPFATLVDNLQEALKIARRTDSEKKPETEKGKEKRQERIKNPDKDRATGYALRVAEGITDTKQKKYEAQPRCAFCDGDHLSFTCPKVKSMSVKERHDKVKTKRTCFNCLRPGHYVEECRGGPCKKCNRKHHTLLHYEKQEPREDKPEQIPKVKEAKETMASNENQVTSSVSLVKALTGPKEILMQSGVAKVESEVATTNARVLFDSGSGVNFISKKVARRLSLRGRKTRAEFTLAGGSVMQLATEEVKFCLSSAIPNWRGEVFEIIAYVIDKPSAALNKVELDLSRMPHLKGLPLADDYPRSSTEVDVMLGLEDTLNILTDERVTGSRGTPIAQKSHIGWILSGTYPTTTSQNIKTPPVNRVTFTIEDPTEIATKHWELEHIGILPEEKKGVATEIEEYAVRQHCQLTAWKGERYETGLIRHPDWLNHPLKTNKGFAETRLKGLERRFANDIDLANQYEAEIQDLIDKGRAKKIEEDQEPNDRNVWYLPHHPVIRKDKTTTKMRIVFDGSAKGPEKISLNDTLLPGPALQPDILAVLLRFRRHPVAIVADIEKMFLQIKINEKDQDSQRFLWRSMNTKRQPDSYCLTGVTFGLTCSPFSSIQTLINHVKSQQERYPKAAEEVINNVFVDDILSGAETVTEAAQMMQDMKNMMAAGGFPLKKFLSNKPEALTLLDKSDLATNHPITLSNEIFATKALGVKYIPSEDILMFPCYEKMDQTRTETRRTLLQQLHRIYDPMGMLSPFTVRAKQIFQRAWMDRRDWDEELPDDVRTDWLAWKNEVYLLDEIKQKRCLVPEDFKEPKFSLHAFGDASEAAYGAVVYLRVEDGCSPRIHINLLCSRTRVTPLGKRRTIPELELMAALIAARLVKYVEREIQLKLESIHCWTDSKVALAWISQPSYKWQVFVANRVSEIQQLVEPNHWRHVPGKQNPADLCSRGCPASDLIKTQMWWKGPEFLQVEEKHWPKKENLPDQSEIEATGKRQKNKQSYALIVSTTSNHDPCEEYVKRFESYGKFIRVFTTIRKWLTKYRQGRAGHEGSTCQAIEHPVLLQDTQNEERWWIRWIQSRRFRSEIHAAKQGVELPKMSKLTHLDPIWDEDKKLLRVGGRLQASLLPDEAKRPIILPSHEPLVEKLVMHYHVKHCHTGVAQTLANLRSKYWLVHGRQEVRRILHGCRTCRRLTPMNQKMAPLPPLRVAESLPFMYVGTDFAGPLYVKAEDGNTKKAYIIIFSCMTTRAVHLELTEDMTTIEFLKAFERMTNRRGRCSIMYSDNAKTFKSASNILFHLYHNTNNRKTIEEKFTREGVEWRFITERAPWHGGFYERMVRSIKTPLRKILGKAKLSFREVETLLTNIEAQINSRPLTDVSADKKDPLPLTPSHLLIGRNLLTLPEVPKQIKATTLGKRWQYRQRMEKQFWSRWHKEYLAELNQYHKWTNTSKNAKPGDVVLVAEDNVKKQDWLLGRITEVHHGRDELVRSVTLKTKRGLIRRPIQRLYPLEAANDDENLQPL